MYLQYRDRNLPGLLEQSGKDMEIRMMPVGFARGSFFFNVHEVGMDVIAILKNKGIKSHITCRLFLKEGYNQSKIGIVNQQTAQESISKPNQANDIEQKITSVDMYNLYSPRIVIWKCSALTRRKPRKCPKIQQKEN